MNQSAVARWWPFVRLGRSAGGRSADGNGDRSGRRPPRTSRRARRIRSWLLALGTLAVYAVLFPSLFAALGTGATAWAIVPVAVAGWLLGFWVGLLAGLVALPLNALFLGLAGDPAWLAAVRTGGWQASLALVMIGTALGRLRDLNERVKEQIAARRRAEERATRLGKILDHASNEIYLFDAESLRFLQVNQAASRNLGFSPDELAALTPLDLLPGLDAEQLEALLAPLRNGEQPEVVFESVIRRKDGSLYPAEGRLQVSRSEGTETFVAIVQDLSERRMFEEQLRRQASYDPLTKLPNRVLFVDQLEHALARSARRGDGVAVLFLDLDRFKLVNDSLGHEAGDRLLVAVAQRLEAGLRAGDTIARFGSDELVVLLEGVRAPDEATAVVERLLALLEQPFSIDGRDVFVTASAGVALSVRGAERPADLLRHADAALHRAKADGRSRYAIFDPSMIVRPADRLALETDLRRAVERGELRLYYQPEVHLQTGQIVGVEALVRWVHPVRGLIPPEEFISIAEESDLILAVDRWVLEAASQQARAWHLAYPSNPPLMIGVNVSARQFHQPDLVDRVAETVRSSEVDPRTLRLEVTEGVLLSEGPLVVARLLALKLLGVRLAIDDFGTGYSSLTYLRHLTVDTLKIDRSFVSGPGREERKAAILRAVTSLAHALGMDVTAEGVETAEQLARLRAIGCDRGQGFYFARPMPAEAIGRLLAARRPVWNPGDARRVA